MPELVHAAAPDTMQVKLERALAGVLRKMGLVGRVSPCAEVLLQVARGYCDHRMVLAADDGKVTEPFSACLAKPSDELDKSIPF